MSPVRDELSGRLAVVATAFATVAIVLAVRLMWLGAVADASDDVVSESLPGPRGSMWDRNGQLVATERLTGTQRSIGTAALANGRYQLVIIDGMGTRRSGPFVVMH